jgi:hypothetical protein
MTYSRSFLGFALLTAGILSCIGCPSTPLSTQNAPAIGTSSRQTVTRNASQITVRSHPDYKKAEALVQSGKKAEAVTLLSDLRKLSTLSEADKDFLDKQIAICEAKETVTVVTNTTSTTPRPSNPEDANCGARALTLAAKELGVKADVKTLTKAAHTDANGANLEGLEAAAKQIGLKSESVQVDKDALENLQTPAIAWWEGNHYVVLLKINKNNFTGTTSAKIHDPNSAVATALPLSDLLAKSGGIFLTLKR